VYRITLASSRPTANPENTWPKPIQNLSVSYVIVHLSHLQNYKVD